MKKTAGILSIILFLLMISACASTSKTEKTAEKVQAYCFVLELGEYTIDEVRQIKSIEQLKERYLYEETTGLKIDIIDGKDYYEGTCLYGLPMTDIKEKMGQEKFGAYWAACFEISHLKRTDTDTRLIKYIFSNNDYFIIDMQGNIQDDMSMTINET